MSELRTQALPEADVYIYTPAPGTRLSPDFAAEMQARFAEVMPGKRLIVISEGRLEPIDGQVAAYRAELAAKVRALDVWQMAGPDAVSEAILALIEAES